MLVFNQCFKISKNEDGSFNFAIALSDSTVVVKTVAKTDLQQLYIDIENILK